MHNFALTPSDRTTNELPASEHPVNRMMERSAEYLSDTELIALIIGSRMTPVAALDTARQLIGTAGGLNRVADLSIRELMRIPGIGKATACTLHSAFALASRHLDTASGRTFILDSPGEVARFLAGQLADKQQEEFHVLLVNSKNHLISDRIVTIGLLDRSQVHAREVFRWAIREAASRVILAHNHPSGDTTPSAQDIACTKNLAAAGRIIGIEVLDHVIIGRPTADRPKDWLSFREEGLM